MVLVLALLTLASGRRARPCETADPPVAVQFGAPSRYRVEFLNINTPQAEFCPVYYQDGLVFCAQRGNAQRGDAQRGDADQLDLYFVPNLAELKPVAGNTPPPSLRKFTESATSSNRLGTDGGRAPSPAPTPATTPARAGDFQRQRPPEAINTPDHDGPATFTRDGSRIVFTRTVVGGPAGGLPTGANQRPDDAPKLRLYTAEARNGGWVNVRELPFNAPGFSCGHPAFAPDDQTLYFASDRPGGLGGTDLYAVPFRQGTWGTPVNLGPGVNGAGNEVYPFADERGLLCFASDGFGGLGGLDLFQVDPKAPGAGPVNLGEPFNSPADDFGLLADGDRRGGFFSSNRRGNDDIYRFTRDVTDCRYLTLTVVDAATQEPLDSAAVTSRLPTGYAETRPTLGGGRVSLCLDAGQDYVLRTERTGYAPTETRFTTRNLAENEAARLVISLQKEPKDAVPKPPGAGTPKPEAGGERLPEGVSRLQGVIRDAAGKPLAGVLVRLTNDCGGPEQRTTTGPEGRYVFFTLNGCDYTLEATRPDYGTHTGRVRDREPVVLAKKPGSPPKKTPAADAKPTSVPTKSPVSEKETASGLSLWKPGDLLPLTLHHDPGPALLTGDDTRELDNVAAILKKYPALNVEIRAHTDSRGEAEANRAASQRRAEAVLAYLVGKGIARGRLRATGYGESQPLNECRDGIVCTEAEYRKNRRTEFKVVASHSSRKS